MSDTTRTVRVRFDGTVTGLAKAARTADRELSRLTKHEKGINRAFDALGAASKGLVALGAAANTAGAIAGVGAAVASTAGALLLLPGAAATARIGLGVLNMAAGDFFTAMSNLDDTKAFNKALKGMGDSAKGVAVQVKTAYDTLAEGLDETVFEGLGDKLKPLIAATLPELDKAFESIGKSANRTGHEILDMLNKAERQADLKKLIGDSSKTWDQLLASVTPLSEAFLDVAVVGSEMLADMTKGAGAASKRFAAWVKEMRETGKIRDTILGGVDGLKDLGRLLQNVGQIGGLVFRGLGTGQTSFTEGMIRTTQAVEDFLASARGQETLKALGDTLRVVGDVTRDVLMAGLREFGPVIKEVAPAAQEFARGLGDFLVGAIETVGPMLRGLARFLSENKDVIRDLTPVVAGLVVTFKGLQIASQVAGWVTGATTALGLLGDKADAAAGKVGKGGKGGLVGALGGLKALGAAAALGAVAYGMDQVNTSAAGGAQNLQGFEENLHDIVGAAKQILTLDFGGIFTDLNAELSEWKRNLQTGFNTDGSSNVGKFFGWLKRQMSEPLPPMKFDVDTGPGERQLSTFIRAVNSAAPEVNINGNNNGAGFALRTIVEAINRGEGTVIIDGQPMPAQDALKFVVGLINNSAGDVDINGNRRPAGSELATMLGIINRSSASVNVDARTGAADAAARAFVARWQNRTIYVNFGGSRVTGATGGAVVGGTIVPHFAAGGPVRGPGSGTSDRVPAMLSNGEYVMNAAEVKAAGGFAGMRAISDALRSGQSSSAAGALRGARRPRATSAGPAGGGTVRLVVAPGSDGAVAAMFMALVRERKIQLKVA